ncbi:hypothetical protein [Kitasatospora sp. NPDC006786]|uniref:hypothetical protein n=1 Tax=unclassified Kitasatospora TaxID=2633591 RepID=UPI0033CFE362
MRENHQMLQLATLGAVWAVLSVAHTLADHVLGQSDHQAAHKAAPTREQIDAGTSPRRGWGACLAHVGQYHAVVVGVYWLVGLAVALPATWLGATTAIGWSAFTHAILDRRWIVRAILEHTGSPKFATLQSDGISGPYLADQAHHATALLGSAVLLARL